MVEFITSNAVTIIFAVVGIVLAAFLIVKYIRHMGLESIRERVYQAFLDAEHEFQYGENTEKFEYVLNIAKSAIPAPFNLFITEALLRKVVQAWFDLVKDLLDDGEFNGTSNTESEAN
jgi:hypothetical protein